MFAATEEEETGIKKKRVAVIPRDVSSYLRMLMVYNAAVCKADRCAHAGLLVLQLKIQPAVHVCNTCGRFLLARDK